MSNSFLLNQINWVNKYQKIHFYVDDFAIDRSNTDSQTAPNFRRDIFKVIKEIQGGNTQEALFFEAELESTLCQFKSPAPSVRCIRSNCQP